MYNAPIPRAIELIGALGIATALDRTDRSALRQRGPDNDLVHTLSETGNALGTANHIIPGLAAAYVLTQLRQTPNGTPDVLDAAIGYAASDLTAGAIRWAVGRERPPVHGDPMHFHPFTGRGEYHSFPSGHVTHIMAIATAAAMESHSVWVHDLADGAVGLVAWQRIHADQHWTSDVVGAAIISGLVSHEAINLLRQRRGVH
jgi:membrane-associated phospholipid phosphatase